MPRSRGSGRGRDRSNPVENLYYSTDPILGPARAATLGASGWCGYLTGTYAFGASMPCVILNSPLAPSGAVILQEPTFPGSVAAVAASFLAAEASAAAVVATQQANRAILVQRAQTALVANASFLANPSVTTAQALAQVTELTRQTGALIRIAINSLDSLGGL